MDEEIDVSVVVPLHNECESVPELILRITQAFEHEFLQSQVCELILVDDGSSDSTFVVAKQVASMHRQSIIRVLSLRRNHGQTAAMQVGFDLSRGRIVVSLDGDLQNDPADIPYMVQLLVTDDLDIVCGRRTNRQDKLWSRKVPSWLANRLIGWATGIQVSDYGCSLKVYRAEVLHQVHLIGEMHRFIPAWFSKITNASRMREVDVRHFPRVHGKTHYGISRTLRVLIDLLSVVFFARYKNRPGHFFGMVGFAMVALSGIMLLSAVLETQVLGVSIDGRTMLYIGLLAFFSGIQVLCLAIMSEMLARVYGQTQAAIKPSILADFSNMQQEPENLHAGKAA